MNHYAGIYFRGEFRSYQHRVLKNVGNYLKDGKINIVAAPGSGKTVLGLELIRRLEEPCLILSPTTAIREQWGQRFRDLFLGEESCFEELFSTDLHKPKLLNSITYQALYSAMECIPEKAEGEVDCSDIDLIKIIKKHGIKTICLDEAHHLKNEWQKALEKFLNRLDDDVKRICLTATPPYDADVEEWSRYYSICGEIDEEIFVPELVAHGNLCPHQDYVYFNYPSPQEEQAFWEYKEQVRAVLAEVEGLECMQTVADQINYWDGKRDAEKKKDKQYFPLKRCSDEAEALLVLLQYYGKLKEIRNVLKLIGRKKLPKPEEIYFEKALQFMVDEGSRFCDPKQIQELEQILKKHHVYNQKRVRLTLTEKLRKDLISSVGKLKSIKDITIHEYRTMGRDLRMLILTDYNRGTKENLNKIGTDEPFHDISVISIFETLRRLGGTLKIGVLSGSLIFLPREYIPEGTMVKTDPLGETGYMKVDVYGSNQDRIELVGSLFREGKIQVLVGTKALLGEGWDEPCINSLILASFVGTFVSSNQMRGRAIRSNTYDPDKTANIWHLVTLEPPEVVKESALERLVAAKERDRETLQSCDFDVVKRRFDTFMAPHYETGEIQSGVERLTLIRPPYDANNILKINEEMLALSADRDTMHKMWKEQLVKNSYQVVVETKLPLENSLPSAGYLWKREILPLAFAGVAGVFLITLFIVFLVGVFLSGQGIQGLASCAMLFPLVCVISFAYKAMYFPAVKRAMKTFSCNRTPIEAIEAAGIALARTLSECKVIARGGWVEVVKYPQEEHTVGIQLQNATMHDQSVFNTAIREMMSPIEKPRYLLVPERGGEKDKYSHALACPSVIGKKEEFVKVLKRNLNKNLGDINDVYTGYEEGRKILKLCQDAHSAVEVKRSKQELPLLKADTKYVVVRKE